VAGVREVVDGTSGAARSAAAVIVGVGDGLVGGVVGGVSGAVNGLTRNAAVRRLPPGVALAAAGVAAGALGLVDWPLLALAGGAALVVRQLGGAPAASSGSTAVPARKTAERTTKVATSRRGGTATARKASTPAKRTARKRASGSASAASQRAEE